MRSENYWYVGKFPADRYNFTPCSIRGRVHTIQIIAAWKKLESNLSPKTYRKLFTIFPISG